MEQPVSRSDVADIAQYEKIRPGFRARVLAEKEHRRVAVGPHFNFTFENRLSVLYQIQEMMRVERIVDEAAISHEIETYNELLPSGGGLAATLFIEYQTPAERAVHLPKLLGVERGVRLEVDDLPPVAAEFDRRQVGEDRVSSVQYLRFPLQEAHRRAWLEAARQGTLHLVVEHPHYRHRAAIGLPVAEALAADFA
ncbi:MAG: DUF3501 family protein [Candidatus Lambdaproteobacteria bacterium]|nr:DUF3501 family protein [Candidatus Lambdaproteobacteria bacterium]